MNGLNRVLGRALVAGCALLGGVALAQSRPGTGSETSSPRGSTPGGSHDDQMGNMGRSIHHEAKPGSSSTESGRGTIASQEGAEPKKHLAEVDVYLSDALNNSKSLWHSSQLAPGKLDSVMQKESVNNIERSVRSALTHVGHLKSMPEARLGDQKGLEQLQSDLKEVKTFTSQLRSAVGGSDRKRVTELSSQLFSRLRSADESFGRIATAVNLTRVDSINIDEKQPVSGSDSESDEDSEHRGGVGRDSDLERSSPSEIDRDKSMDDLPSTGTGLEKPVF